MTRKGRSGNDSNQQCTHSLRRPRSQFTRCASCSAAAAQPSDLQTTDEHFHGRHRAAHEKMEPLVLLALFPLFYRHFSNLRPIPVIRPIVAFPLFCKHLGCFGVLEPKFTICPFQPPEWANVQFLAQKYYTTGLRNATGTNDSIFTHVQPPPPLQKEGFLQRFRGLPF